MRTAPRTIRRRAAPIALAVALVLGIGVVSCGGDDDGDAATTTLDRPATTDRLGGDDGSGDGSSTSAPPVTSGTTATTRPLGAGARLTFRPVTTVAPCATTNPGGDPLAATTTTEPGTAPETTIPTPTDPELVASRDGTTCYRLGPVAATGDDIEDAVVSQQTDDPDQWVIDVAATPEGRGRLNDLFNACFDGADICPGGEGADPHGAVAIVYDGSVLTAPAVNGLDLADAGFAIFGDLREAEARELAALINA